MAILTAAALAPNQGGMAKDEGVDGKGGRDYLIRFAHAGSRAEQAQAVADLGGMLVDWLPQINVATVRFPDDAMARQATARLMAGRQASSVEPDSEVSGDGVFSDGEPVDDPDFVDAQHGYGQQRVQLAQALAVTYGQPDIMIAILDSGINLTHPEFAGRVVPGYDFINKDDDPSDDAGHGTPVAGIAAMAVNGVGSVGICPACTILPVKVLNEEGKGTFSRVVHGILYATDQGARIINLSLGSTTDSAIMREAIAYAHDRGVIIVASAGNFGNDTPYYPAAYEHVLAVGATNVADEWWSKSNFGDWVDVTAPGVAIYSTSFGEAEHPYADITGTSAAAPFVSGLAALILSQQPELTAEEVQALIIENASDLGQPSRDDYYGYGRIDVLRTLTAVAPAASEAQGEPEQKQGLIYLPAVVR
jgi:subtilisin family serine protease